MRCTWQTTLVQIVVAAGLLAALVVTLCAFLISSSPKGPGAEGPTGLTVAAIALTCTSCTAFLVLIAGFLKEREALGERAPRFPCPCLLCVLLLLVFVVPMFHLGFALSVAAIAWAALLLVPTPELQLRVAAFADALLSLAVAEAARRAGPAGDFVIARVLLALQGLLPVALLPGLVVVASLGCRPGLAWTARLAGWGYGLMALQAAVLALWAIGAMIVGGGVSAPAAASSSGACLRSVAESPAGALLSWFGSFAEGDPFPGPAGQAAVDPCAGLEPPASPCDVVGAGVLAFCVLAGVYIAAWVAVCTVCRLDSERVVPEVVGETAPPPAKLSAFRRSRRRIAVAVGLGVGAAALGLLGYLELPCPSSRAGESTTAAPVRSNCTQTRIAPSPGCRCGESGSRGVEAWFAIPVEQIALMWCEMDLWASLFIGFLVYVYHGFICSLALKHAARCRGLDEEKQYELSFPNTPSSAGGRTSFNGRDGLGDPGGGPRGLGVPHGSEGPSAVQRPSGPAPELRVGEQLALMAPGSPAGSPTAGSAWGGAIQVFKPAPKERRPLPSGEIGDERIFAV